MAIARLHAKETPVRHTLLRGAFVCVLVAPVVAGCVLPPEPGSSAPPEAGVVEADARALAFGRSAGEILENPQLRDKVRALFGADWEAPTPGVGKLSAPAAQYFELGGPVRMVRIGDANYIAVTGCARQACAGRRGLLLVRDGGEQLMARLDEGGFSHHYAFGPGLAPGPTGGAGAAGGPDRAGVMLGSALRALERVSDDSPFPRPPP
jgi:hypothetical protein